MLLLALAHINCLFANAFGEVDTNSEKSSLADDSEETLNNRVARAVPESEPLVRLEESKEDSAESDDVRSRLLQGGTITLTPTKKPRTVKPTSQSPTKHPSRPPTLNPTKRPTKEPTTAPTKRPTNAPSKTPTKTPTNTPTKRPTKEPTAAPTSDAPSKRPTREPTNTPTKRPTKAPTTIEERTRKPTKTPTNQPTSEAPTKKPTKARTNTPTKRPTNAPTKKPTSEAPSKRPTKAPTTKPTSDAPTKRPTKAPTNRPTTGAPTRKLTKIPTKVPTSKSPTSKPTKRPTGVPTRRPTSKRPTRAPTGAPTTFPTRFCPEERCGLNGCMPFGGTCCDAKNEVFCMSGTCLKLASTAWDCCAYGICGNRCCPCKPTEKLCGSGCVPLSAICCEQGGGSVCPTGHVCAINTNVIGSQSKVCMDCGSRGVCGSQCCSCAGPNGNAPTCAGTLPQCCRRSNPDGWTCAVMHSRCCPDGSYCVTSPSDDCCPK